MRFCTELKKNGRLFIRLWWGFFRSSDHHTGRHKYLLAAGDRPLITCLSFIKPFLLSSIVHHSLFSALLMVYFSFLSLTLNFRSSIRPLYSPLLSSGLTSCILLFKLSVVKCIFFSPPLFCNSLSSVHTHTHTHTL